MEAFSVLPSRTDIIREHRARGGGVAAIFPIHYPRALIRAFDILPVEVWGPPGLNSGQGTTHLQPYVCSIVQNALAFLDSGGLDAADILIVPHACDSLQGLGSILIDFTIPRQPVLPVYIPRGRRESDIAFFTDELHALYDRLEEITGKTPSNQTLMESVYREENADNLLSELHRRRQSLPLTGNDLYVLIRSREYLPAEIFSAYAQEILSQAGSEVINGTPIILSGIVLEPKTLFKTLADLGFLVIADDLACCGRRLYPPGNSQDPFSRMAESLLRGPPDPSRGDSIASRLQHLQKLVKDTGANGIIFYLVKFCEPELFHIPILRKELGADGIPSITIEIDINDPLSLSTFTRMEAFMEQLL